MKIYLKKAIFINRAPFQKIELNFNENDVTVLSAINGSGKTTIISHIVDAFYEMARSSFPNEFEGRENKFYRISSSINNMNRTNPSFVYLRFVIIDGESIENIDYIDIRNKCTEEEYNQSINIENKIPFSDLLNSLESMDYIKKISSNFNKEKAKKYFSNNLLTYFPSYRYEEPGYLNDPYKINLDFNKTSGFSGLLKNKIEVISGLPQLANWIMDIVLDSRNVGPFSSQVLFGNINTIITQTLVSKNYGNLRFGIGPRNYGSLRLQIVKAQDSSQVYPTIFNLSSGESSLLCLFGEILRQADNNKENILLSEVTGIVLIDEVDKHLHIKIQKEVLPKLFELFPNVQFIVSSHSPFLGIGLAETIQDRSKILDLDNGGVVKSATNNELYEEVYKMMVVENERFKKMYEELNVKVGQGTEPLIITEGKTDIAYIKKAKEILGINDIDVEYFEFSEDVLGDTALNTLLENMRLVSNNRKIIGIFDRDNDKIIRDIEKDGRHFKNYGNNVFAFCLPLPSEREAYKNISIEFYFKDSELKKEKNGKCLYFDNEIDYLYNKSLNQSEIRKLDIIRTQNELEKKVFCENIGNYDWIHSKTAFSELIENDADFINDFDFHNFNLIFDRIREIINYQETHQENT